MNEERCEHCGAVTDEDATLLIHILEAADALTLAMQHYGQMYEDPTVPEVETLAEFKAAIWQPYDHLCTLLTDWEDGAGAEADKRTEEER